jgi:hypothetical protein
MQVHLRHAHVGLYYAGRKHWVSNPNAALDLGTIERASELSEQEDFTQMEIVAEFDEPGCELVLAVARRKPRPEAVGTVDGALQTPGRAAGG